MKRSLKFCLYSKLIICFLFTTFLVLIRTYQLASFIDCKTGFYDGPSYLNYCFFGGIFLLLAFLFIFSFFENYNSTVDFGGNLLLKVVGVFAAIFSVIYSFFILFNLKRYDVTNVHIPILLFVANILLSIGLIYLVVRLKKFGNYIWADILFLFPVLWACLRLISMFLNTMIMFSVQENVLNVFKTSSICVFLFCVGKFFSGFYSNTTKKKMNIFGFFSVCLIFCSALPRYIMFFISGFAKNCYLNVSDLASLDFVLSIFILIFLISYALKSKNRNI